jgi:hypothetical protein
MFCFRDTHKHYNFPLSFNWFEYCVVVNMKVLKLNVEMGPKSVNDWTKNYILRKTWGEMFCVYDKKNVKMENECHMLSTSKCACLFMWKCILCFVLFHCFSFFILFTC